MMVMRLHLHVHPCFFALYMDCLPVIRLKKEAECFWCQKSYLLPKDSAYSYILIFSYLYAESGQNLFHCTIHYLETPGETL